MNLVLCFMGPPGSGKSTHAKRLTKELGLDYIVLLCELGSLLRQKAKCSPSGCLSTLQDVLELVDEFLDKKGDLYILDGYPRSDDQALAIQERCMAKSLDLCIVHLFNNDNDLLKERLLFRRECSQCGNLFVSRDVTCPKCNSDLTHQRADDIDLEAIKTRMNIYKNMWEKVYQSLDKSCKLIEIECMDMEDNYRSLLNQVAGILKND